MGRHWAHFKFERGQLGCQSLVMVFPIILLTLTNFEGQRFMT